MNKIILAKIYALGKNQEKQLYNSRELQINDKPILILDESDVTDVVNAIKNVITWFD